MVLTLAIGLLVLGTVLICVEMFVPGFGIAGVTGIALVIISAILTVIASPIGLFIVAGEIVVLTIVIVAVFDYVKKRQLHGKLILDETLDFEKKDIGDLEYFIGKEGMTKTSLRPVGIADFNGVSLEVCSDGGYIAEKTRVKVFSVSNQKIVVKQISQENN